MYITLTFIINTPTNTNSVAGQAALEFYLKKTVSKTVVIVVINNVHNR